MQGLCGRLMQGLCGRLMRDAYALLMHNVCAKIEFLVASTGGLCSPLCRYAAFMQGLCTDQTERRQDDRRRERERERERQRKRDREREGERERQTHRAPATDKHRHRETESNRVAHRALCKPLMRISLSQNLSCCLCAAWFLLSGAVFWLMRAHALPTWFEESLMQCLCGLFFDSLFFSIRYSTTTTTHHIHHAQRKTNRQ